MVVRLSSTTFALNIRSIWNLGSATGKKIIPIFNFLQHKTKKEPFLQINLEKREYSYLSYASPDT